MKFSLRLPMMAASLLAAVALAAVTVAQSAPAQSAPPAHPRPGMHGEHGFPPPTNLQVLPKNLTTAQVLQIMHGWAGDLGVGCNTCHAEYPNHRTAPNGWPMLDFASDAKPEKRMARIMYRMLETDKKDYVAKVAAMDAMAKPAPPLTCGTCHRGHLVPEAYVPPRREEAGGRH